MEQSLELKLRATSTSQSAFLSSMTILEEPLVYVEEPDSPLHPGKRGKAGDLETPFKQRRLCQLTPKGRDLTTTPCLGYSLPRRTLLSDSPFWPDAAENKENHMDVEF